MQASLYKLRLDYMLLNKVTPLEAFESWHEPDEKYNRRKEEFLKYHTTLTLRIRVLQPLRIHCVCDAIATALD